MDKLKYVKLENKDGSYSDSIPLAVDSDHVDVNGNTLTNELNNKANVINVNSSINSLQNQINSLASGSPLVANSISKMTDTTRVYVLTIDGHWYYYNGTTWVDGGLYQASSDYEEINERLNEDDKKIQNIIDNSYNKYNLSYSKFEQGQISSSGINTTFPSRFRTKDYIKVLKGTSIETDGNVQFNICTFSDKNTSSLLEYRTFSTNIYIVSQNCYIRFSINDGSSSETFNEERVDSALSHITLNLLEESKNTDIENRIQNINDNLYNKHNLSYSNFEQGQISSTGINNTFPSRFRTIDYIKVLKGSSISSDGNVQFNICTFSDKDSSYLIDYRTYGIDKFIINQDCYIRFSIDDGSSSENFNAKRVNNALNHMTLNLYYDKYIINPENNNISKIIEICSQFSKYNFNQAIVPYYTTNKLSTLYDLWDGLLNTYSSFITKTVLGTTTDNLEIRKYTINSHNENIALQQIPKQKLTILYVGSMHGNEETIALDDYMMFKDILDNYGTNDALKNLFDNVIFEVIPTINPYGYEHHIRNNGNNVNINRNFNANWVYSDNEYNSSGQYPESEIETQILCDYIRNNKDKIFLVINRHSTASLTAGGVIGYFASGFKSDLDIGYSTIKALNSQMRSNFDWLKTEYTNNQNCFTLKKTGEFHGSFDEWYSGVMNLHGFLIELATTSGDDYTGSRDDMRKIAITTVVSLLENVIIKNKYICENDYKFNEVSVID